MQIANLSEVEPFITLDGSTIREVAAPGWTAARNQSLAEATVPPGGRTAEHYHRETEELYLFTRGRGRMRLGGEEQDVGPGDCVVIPPGVRHKLWNASESEPLVLLCCCSPAYRHDDTVMTEDD